LKLQETIQPLLRYLSPSPRKAWIETSFAFHRCWHISVAFPPEGVD